MLPRAPFAVGQMVLVALVLVQARGGEGLGRAGDHADRRGQNAMAPLGIQPEKSLNHIVSRSGHSGAQPSPASTATASDPFRDCTRSTSAPAVTFNPPPTHTHTT